MRRWSADWPEHGSARPLGLFPTDLRLRKVELRDPKDLYAATSPGGRGFWCHELLADQLTADGIHILR